MIMRKFPIILAMLSIALSPNVSAKEYLSVSASGVAVTGNGRVWTGTIAMAEDGSRSVILSHSDDFVKWTTDTLSIEDCIESVLWNAPDGILHMFCSTTDGNIKTRLCRNHYADEPEWTHGTEIGRGPWKCTSPPVVSFGAWVLPVSFQKGVFTLTSKDNGCTWSRNRTFLRVPDKVSGDNNPVITNDGQTLSIYMRSTGTTQCYRSQSSDNGLTWGAPEAFMPNPDKDICFGRLPDGRLLMVKCSRLDHNVHVASQKIIAYLSDDNGQTWYGGLVINADRKASGPRTTIDKDGNIYVFYTYDAEGNPQTRICRTTAREIERGTIYKEVKAKSVQTLCVAGKAEQAASMLTVPKTDWACEPLRLATWNIQYLAKQPSWKNFRLPAIKALLDDYRFDVFGSQEPYLPQIEDMMEAMSDIYAWVGECTGEKDSRRTHYNPIFYRKERLELLQWGTVPFSEVKGTIGFGAMYERNCTWAKFRDRLSENVFFLFNCHFDHQGVEAREVSAEILVRTVRKIAAGYPAFMTGDFNSDEDTLPYKIVLKSGFISDTINAVDNPKNAEYFSMSRYKPISTVKKTGKHIDHVFYTPNSAKVVSWKLITDSYDDKFGSDHLPIMVEVLTAN